MAYTLTGIDPLGHAIIATGAWIKNRVLSCYDTIDDPDFDLSRDEVLRIRSALELARDQLTPDQQAELDEIDAYWRANAEAFNADFGVFHFQGDKRAALKGFIEYDHGQAPPILRGRWYWRPIEDDQARGFFALRSPTTTARDSAFGSISSARPRANRTRVGNRDLLY